MTDEEKKIRKKEYDIEYRKINKEKLIKNSEIYRQLNSEKLKTKQKEHYYLNKEKLSNNKKNYYDDNKEKILNKCKEYRKNNPKEKNGKLGTGNYNITLAERHKEKWINEKMFLYKLIIAEDDGTIFYKIGLTKNLKNRLYYIPYKVNIISVIEISKYDAIYLEKKLLTNVNSYSPKIKFGGHTECYII